MQSCLVAEDIEDLVKSCYACQSVRQAPPEALLHPWSWPTRSWQRVHINFAGLFQGKMYFLAMDAHSKWPEVFELSQTTTEKTIALLRTCSPCMVFWTRSCLTMVLSLSLKILLFSWSPMGSSIFVVHSTIQHQMGRLKGLSGPSWVPGKINSMVPWQAT